MLFVVKGKETKGKKEGRKVFRPYQGATSIQMCFFTGQIENAHVQQQQVCPLQGEIEHAWHFQSIIQLVLHLQLFMAMFNLSNKDIKIHIEHARLSWAV